MQIHWQIDAGRDTNSLEATGVWASCAFLLYLAATQCSRMLMEHRGTVQDAEYEGPAADFCATRALQTCFGGACLEHKFNIHVNSNERPCNF
jgi:hypothetical protein